MNLSKVFFTPIAAVCAAGGLHAAEPTTKGIIKDLVTECPEGATQLVGKDKSVMVPEKEDGPHLWKYEDGILTASPKWDSVVTPDEYQDFRLHVEFNVNDNGQKSPEKNGNSGIYIQKRYEIQISNAFGVSKEKYTPSYCASVYKIKVPDKIVCKPAGEWQTYDIVFRAARFKDGEKTENARITVYHNGELVHDDYEIPRKTGAGNKEGPEPGPIKLQGHDNPVKFRNVWVQKLEL